jgi:uncharacterized protein (TIGR02646 family)
LRNLIRSTNSPECLSEYTAGLDNWEKVTGPDKKLIWKSIYTMQGKYCAYCECALLDNKKHIEHFVQKGRDNSKTFDWYNLFGSCRYNDRCGVYKDKQKYNPSDLIKADRDQPENYFSFLTDGSIRPMAGLSHQDNIKAKETIRVFKLDDQLKHIRYSFIFPFIETAEFLFDLVDQISEDEWLKLFNEELESLSDSPFYSAIKSVLLLNRRY